MSRWPRWWPQNKKWVCPETLSWRQAWKFVLCEWLLQLVGTTGKCFKALFGRLFGPGALPPLRLRMASWISMGLVYLGLLAGAKEHACIASSPISMNADSDGRLPAETKLVECRCFFRVLESNSPQCDQGRWRSGKSHQHLVMFHGDWSSEPRLSSAELHWLSLISLNWWVTDLRFQRRFPCEWPLPP
jgi:hypothetical protein